MGHTKPLKILHVVGAMNRGGTETMLMNIYRNIDHEHVQFDFISYSQQEADYDQEIKRNHGRVFQLTKTNSLKQIYDVIKKYGPYDVVHAHTLFHCGIANLAARLAGVKVRIAHAHTTFDESNNVRRNLYMKGMRVIIQLFSTNLLACSRGAGAYLFGRKGIAKQMYSYFPNTIDYATFLTASAPEVQQFKKEAGLEQRIVIGHVGRFTEAKNHHFLLNIMQAAKTVVKKDVSLTLLLVGDGDMRAEIEAEAANRGLQDVIHFAGKRDDVATMLHSMDVFVFPSTFEGLGLVLLEAQASGLPCVVSEAIQPEADLKLDLMHQLDLADGPVLWAQKMLALSSKKEADTQKITRRFEEDGYSLTKVISMLMQIYQANKGETDEANTDCVL